MATGSVRKRRRGTVTFWEAVVDLGPDPATGKRRQRTKSYPTQREAKAGLAARLSELARGTEVGRSRQTVADVLLFWLETYARPRVRPTTLDAYRVTIHHHLIPALGAIPVQRLTPAHLQQFYAAKAAAGAGPRVVQVCHRRLSQALALAQALDLVPRNVAQAVSPPPVPPPNLTIWSPEEAQRFLSVAGASAYGPIWLVLATTFMRRGEALGLRWTDVDWEARVLHIRQTVTTVRGHSLIQPPKTPRSVRVIPVPAFVLDALREHRARQNGRRLALGADWHDDDLVFASEVGTPIGARNLARQLEALVRKAGVPRIRIHDIRHTVISHAIAAGAPVNVVAEMAGHADMRITLEVYAHVIYEQRRAVSETVAAIVWSPPADAL